MMKLDMPMAWSKWQSVFGSEVQTALKSILLADFEREVIPELGPECGVAVVGVPGIESKDWDVPVALFFHLTTDNCNTFGIRKPCSKPAEAPELRTSSSESVEGFAAHVAMVF